MKLYLFHGLPSAEKATRATETGLLRANRTDMSAAEQRDAILAELEAGRDVACDDDNLDLSVVKELVELATSVGAGVEHIHVDGPLDTAESDPIVRDAYTSDGSALRTIHHRVAPDGTVMVWRSRDKTIEPERVLAEYNKSLEGALVLGERGNRVNDLAVVFDFDSTLANVSSLVEHYIWERDDIDGFHAATHQAPGNRDVVTAAFHAMFNAVDVLVVTARSVKYVEPTMQWLVNHCIPVTKLYMRAFDDHRPDTEVKRDIIAEIRAEGFNIVAAYEDSPRVIDMLREQGVKTIEVHNPQWLDPRAPR